MKIQFYLRFHTTYGETLSITGNSDVLGAGINGKALPMQYLNDEYWTATLDLSDKDQETLQYHYILLNSQGETISEWGDDRILELAKLDGSDITVYDTWNHAGEYENAFFTQPFREVLLKPHATGALKAYKGNTHVFKVKAPLLKEDEILCVSGSNPTLGNWEAGQVLSMQQDGNWWSLKVNLTKESFPIAYKYGVLNTTTGKLVRFEDGTNRMLYDGAAKKKITILHDGFVHLPNTTWRGAGVSIPVFSLRSRYSFGVGEFADIKLLVDWAKKVGMKLIQILPINDTTATHTWTDSYPYAAISAFALHPMYVSLTKMAGDAKHPLIKSLEAKQAELNQLADVDYEQVMITKWATIKELYQEQKKHLKKDEAFQAFFEDNRHWLVPYAVFSYLRDKYHTPDFLKWEEHTVYKEAAIQKYAASTQKHYDEIAVHYFTQYHLHLQLKEAVAYAHEHQVIMKGDIPIGIYRNSCDAWVEPELYNMNLQAGAPPDDFAVKGQNWGFPTYNWQRMEADGFRWWKNRFEQMSNYFDAFRIDHILGFFRIWSIPMHAVEGIMGYFIPAIPVHISEFSQRGLWFDYGRFCKPFINETVLWELAGDQANALHFYLNHTGNGHYELKEEFNTQRKVEAYFDQLELTEVNNRIRHALYDLISNVILFEVDGSQGQQFHFRISMESTSSYKHLSGDVQHQLKDLYVNYFFRRQDEFWKKEANQKLPALKRATNMLICGEDLGMVPDCVPDVMKQLGLLSLEIQRMPKDPKKTFFHPADAPYLSVVTPSTHDMSTIRGWWEESRTLTQEFYNKELGHWGEAPFFCEPWIVRNIITQHLYSPAMWSIFQIQELLGMNSKLRRVNPHDERINVPANPKHYWRYRMHHALEDLLNETEFNEEVLAYVKQSGRI